MICAEESLAFSSIIIKSLISGIILIISFNNKLCTKLIAKLSTVETERILFLILPELSCVDIIECLTALISLFNN